METNVIQKLQQDEETALDALGELAQKDSTEATIAEYAMINNSVLYKEFLAERQEILCHKWIESEKAGDDIGFERALLDWVVKYRSTWREKRHRPVISPTRPFPTNPLPRHSLPCASLPPASFEAPLSCLRPHPKLQGLRRSGRAAQSPSRYNRWAAHRSR